jgi:choline dehydrogenase-like flavoprotein
VDAWRVEPDQSLPSARRLRRQELGIPFNPDFNGERQEGLGYYQLTQFNARRSSTSIAYLNPIRERKNLTIALKTRALRIVVEGGRAVGVEVVTAGTNAPQVLRAEREVLVSSGAIRSPKPRAQSGIGPADHLRSVGIKVVHDLPGIGNLQDPLRLFGVIAGCTGDHTYD